MFEEKAADVYTDFRKAYVCAEEQARFLARRGDEPELIYDFYIDAIGREIEILYTAGALQTGADAAKHLMLPRRYRQGVCRRNAAVLNVKDANVACLPGKPEKLAKALRQVKNEGYCREKTADGCKGYYFQELNLAVIENAHHHAAAARAYHDEELTMTAQLYCLAPAFHELRVTDELCWSSAPQMYPEDCRPDPRFALLYEFARRRELALQSAKDHYTAFLQEPMLNVSYVNTTQFYPRSILCKLPAWKRKVLRLLGIHVENGVVFQYCRK